MRRALLAALGLFLSGTVAASAAEPFRVCLDPENPPLSMAQERRKGIYYEVAELLAERLGRPLAVVWWPTNVGKRAIRLKLLSGECDAMMGVPFVKGLMGPKVLVAGPLLELGYALVTRAPDRVASPDDLRGRRVAVVFNTPAQNALATLEDVETLTVRDPEEAVEALLEGRADVAFVWDAVAGWYDLQREDVDLVIVAVDGPRLRWESAVGVARGHEPLRDELQSLLDELRPRIAEIARSYGLVHDGTVVWRWADLPPTSREDEDEEQDARRHEPAAETGDGQAASGVAPADGSAERERLAKGKELFNAVLGCSHCHGPDAVGPDRPRDLRLMRHRYGERWKDVFWETVLNGRFETESGLVMPAWRDAASRDELEAILAWIDSLQQ